MNCFAENLKSLRLAPATVLQSANMQTPMSEMFTNEVVASIEARVRYNDLCDTMSDRLRNSSIYYRRILSGLSVYHDGAYVGIAFFCDMWRRNIHNFTLLQNLQMFRDSLPVLRTEVRRIENLLDQAEVGTTAHAYIVACRSELVISRTWVRTFEEAAAEMALLHPIIIRI